MDAIAHPAWAPRKDFTGPRDAISFRLAWIGRMLRSRFDARARTVGLTGAQWRMITVIHLNEGATQSDIAAVLEISSATAGRIVDRLEGNGWLERRSDLVDRRANRLFLKAAAEPMLERLAALGQDEEALALEGFSDAERAQFTDFLGRMIDNLVVATKSDVPPYCDLGGDCLPDD